MNDRNLYVRIKVQMLKSFKYLGLINEHYICTILASYYSVESVEFCVSFFVFFKS